MILLRSAEYDAPVEADEQGGGDVAPRAEVLAARHHDAAPVQREHGVVAERGGLR